MAKNQQAVATIDDVQEPFLYDILAQHEMLRANLGDEAVLTFRDLDRVKVPAGGGVAWMIPTEDEARPETTTIIEGVIISADYHRAYYRTGYDGEANPPDCKAHAPEWKGSQEFNGEFGGDCATCPLNQWRKRPDGKGYLAKPCKGKVTLYVLRPDDLLPIAITLPTTSIKNVNTYFAQMQRRKPVKYPWMVVSTISLKQAKNAGGIVYSVAELTKTRNLDAKEITEVVEYQKLFKQFRERKPLMLEAPDDEMPIDADQAPVSNLGDEEL